jgi:hypothetical protein
MSCCLTEEARWDFCDGGVTVLDQKVRNKNDNKKAKKILFSITQLRNRVMSPRKKRGAL